MAGRPKAPFFIVLVIVVLALVGFAVMRTNIFGGGGGGGSTPGPNGDGQTGDVIDPEELGGIGGAEAADTGAITTVKEYEFVSAQTLPPVQGTSAYKPLSETEDTVRFALNVWAGWAPIIQANGGFKAGKVWQTQDGKDFRVELVLIDDPIAMRDAYATGDVHIGWATLDMVPLFMEGLVNKDGSPKDSRVMPRIFQQVDWSNGGDGIVARADIRTISDLRGRKIVLAQNSPSHYFLLNMLVSGGVQPGEVDMVFTADAFQAAAAFNRDRSLGAAVSWAPDIYNLEAVQANRMLVTTVTANKLIADVWFARADFANDHGDICEALVRGIFDAMEELKTDAGKQAVSQLMAAGYNLPADEALAMLGDAHSTNWAENFQFFVNQNNPANFERVWNQAYYLYRRVGAVTHSRVPFNQVMDYSIIRKLGQEAKYANSTDEYQAQFAPRTVSEIQAESAEILTNTIRIHFYPNSWDLHKTVMVQEGGDTIEKLYDPNVDNVLEEVARLVGTFGLAQVIIEGHTDASMKGRVSASIVKELAGNRANSVKEVLVAKFDLDPNQFVVDGAGWDRPADPDDPRNHAKNRRVEIKVYAAEGEQQSAMADAPEAKNRKSRPRGMFSLRRAIPHWQSLLFAIGFLVVVYLLWTIVTTGDIPEERMVSPTVLPTPTETFKSFPELWGERRLPLNLWVTLRRVVLGFGLAAAVGIPVGVLCGCFTPINAFLLPMTVFGRNIPLAALIPLTFVVFGVGEAQKIMFIFIAAVMFIVSDTATAVRDVDQRYVDTALTLGARRWQVVVKVLTPLAMPSVFNSLRLLFGLAFGYIMLAEIVKFGSEAGGIGDIIRISQRRGLYAHVWLILLIIPVVALLMDKLLYWIQRELFPYRYGGPGLLNRGLRWAIHRWEDLRAMMWQTRRTKVGAAVLAGAAATSSVGDDDDTEPESRDEKDDD